MIKLEEVHSFLKTYEVCKKGITGNKKLLEKLDLAQESLHLIEDKYRNRAETGTLYRYTTFSNSKKNRKLERIRKNRLDKDKDLAEEKFLIAKKNVFKGITKEEFIKLYERYFVSPKKPLARKIYDEILASAKQKCPYCCGIGIPRNLDHYLPKTHFPKFAILPINLIPSCRDCNMDAKGDALILSYEKQLIHPYLDNAHFFLDQWIDISFSSDTLNSRTEFFYFVNPPTEWNELDKERVKNHFKECNLDERFSTQAVSEFLTLIDQIDEMRTEGLSDDNIAQYILEPALRSSCYSQNHWKKVLMMGIKKIILNKNEKGS